MRKLAINDLLLPDSATAVSKASSPFQSHARHAEEMNLTVNTFVLALLLLLAPALGFTRPSFYSRGVQRWAQGASPQLERELDVFFEQAAESGRSRVKSLTPEKRAEMAEKGA